MEVTLSDGRDVEAEVVATDPKSDLAVVRIEGDVDDLQPLAFGSSSSMRLGDVVLAVGNPFGVGQTVTMGIISATGGSTMGIVDYEDFIQTDAAINPGNSGGALVNTRGELIGINTAILSRTGGSNGVGFAIPSDMAKPILESLLQHGKVTRGWLGIVIQDLDDDLAKGLGLSVTEGVLVSDVNEDSPADRAGLKRGDVVVALDGRPVKTNAQLRNRIAVLGPGALARLEIVRDGEKRTVEVELGALEDGPLASAEVKTNKGLLSGLEVAGLSPGARREYGIDEQVQSGVVVTEVRSGSSAQRIGLRPGDVILEINKRPVKSINEFRRLSAKARDAVLLLVNRKGTTLYLALRE